MGLLNIQDVIAAQSPGLLVERGARCHIFAEGSDTLAAVYADPNLTVSQANPMIADETGIFEPCWVFNGRYRIVLETRRGMPIADIDGIGVSSGESLQGFERGFPRLSMLLADSLMDYGSAGGCWTVVPGQILRATDIDGLYEVAASSAVDHDLETAGGVKLYVSRNTFGYNVKAFGAVGDGVTDDSAAIQKAINAALNGGGVQVVFPAGHYHCTDDLWFCHDAVHNTGAPSGLHNGRVKILGAGMMTRWDYRNDHFAGSVIRFAAGKKAIFSTNGAVRSWKKVVQDLSFIGDNGTIVSDTWAASQTTWRRVFVGTEGAQPDTAIFHVSDNYINTFDTIEIIGDKTLTTGRVGWGFWAEPSDTAGGGNIYQNITAAYCDKGLVLGQPYDASATGVNDVSIANTMIACQGHYANVGIHFMQNVLAITATGCWGEQCDVAPIKVSDSAANIEIVSCNGSFASGQVGDRGIVTIGDDTGTAGVDAARNVVVRNCRFFCVDGITGIYVYDAARDVLVERNSFHNGGGGAIGIQGGVGGEITARGNDYFPTTSGSAIAIGKRFCSVSGPSGSATYADRWPWALELDWSGEPYAGDIDASAWRRPPGRVSFNTLSAARQITLPALGATGGRLARVLVMKPYAANTVTVDAQPGNTIKGAQTLALSTAYSSIELLHAGNAATRWDVIQQT